MLFTSGRFTHDHLYEFETFNLGYRLMVQFHIESSEQLCASL